MENNENTRKLESFPTENLTELFAEYLAKEKNIWRAVRDHI